MHQKVSGFEDFRASGIGDSSERIGMSGVSSDKPLTIMAFAAKSAAVTGLLSAFKLVAVFAGSKLAIVPPAVIAIWVTEGNICSNQSFI
jgi:hypothetical protein